MRSSPLSQQNACDWADWLDSPLGSQLSGLEKELLTSRLSKRWGQHLLQVSHCCIESLVEQSPIFYYTNICSQYHQSQHKHSMSCAPDRLAVANEKIDCLVLHHVLEFSQTPHQILREADRVLVPGGLLFILGFNPISLWGLRRSLSWRRPPPWTGYYYSPWRIKDWLQLLDCEYESTEYLHYGIPLQRQSLSYRPKMESVAASLNIPFGGCFLLVARKKVAGMVPLPRESGRQRIMSFPMAEPTARNLKSSD